MKQILEKKVLCYGIICVTFCMTFILCFVPNFRILTQVVAEKSLKKKFQQTDKQREKEKLINKGTDKQYVAVLLLHNTTNHYQAFYGDLVYKLKKIVGSNNFSAQFIKIISHYKKIGYNINVLQQTACLVVNPIKVGNFAFLFNCTPVGWTSDSMMVPT